MLERFYAGKIDLNLAGTAEIEDALSRIDPLGVGASSGTYKDAAQAIAKFRRDSNGVITSISEVNGLSPDLVQKMEPYFTEGAFAVISADVVGAVVGGDLRNRAIYVTLAALAGMLVYIAFRFEWIYGSGLFVNVMAGTPASRKDWWSESPKYQTACALKR
jgi:preprotein translocase subunit SecF